jgi:hypothetical protein
MSLSIKLPCGFAFLRVVNRRKNGKISRRRDLDPRPADYKSAAQPG